MPVIAAWPEHRRTIQPTPAVVAAFELDLGSGHDPGSVPYVLRDGELTLLGDLRGEEPHQSYSNRLGG